MLVERAAELAVLAGVVDAAGSGSGGFVLVAGPAGIGKTSLLAEAARLGASAGAAVLGARAIELEQELAFGVVRQLLGPAVAEHPHRASLVAGAAAPAAAVIGRPDGAASTPGDFAVLHGLYWLTANLCRTRAHVLIIDDLQWADRGTLRYLAYLQPRLSELALVVVSAARPPEPLKPTEPRAEQHLFDLLATDPAATLLRPRTLSLAGTADVVNDALRSSAEPGFVDACQTATGGNPLLLRQLTDAISVDGLAATTRNASRVARLVPTTLGAEIGLRLSRLPDECRALAGAVAVLGDDVPVHHAASLAGLSAGQAVHAAQQLRHSGILGDPAGAAAGPVLIPSLHFVHPLVRAAAYDRIDAAGRPAAHAAAAAQLLDDPTTDPERISAHLLRTPPTGDPETAAILRRSADGALRRGSPDTALTYLRRCLDEPLDAGDRSALLHTAGEIAVGVDLGIADRILSEALAAANDPSVRAEIAHQLGQAWLYLGRHDEFRRLCAEVLPRIPEPGIDLRRRLQARLINLGLAVVRYPELPGLVAELRELDPHPSLGGRMLDAVIAAFDGIAADPDAVGRAERSLDSDLLIEVAGGDPALNCAWWVLLGADRDSAMVSLDYGVARAHQSGSINSLAAALAFRGLGWLCRGHLGEAVSDLRRSVEAADTGQIRIAHIFNGPWLAAALTEQGDLDGAAAALHRVGAPDPLPPGPWYEYLHGKAQLLRRQRNNPDALATALAAGDYFTAIGGRNPALLPWRSEAALCLHALGRTAEARRYATEECELAREWAAPRALGRALRVAGLVHPGPAGLAHLQEAVSVLDGSPARLELGKALIDLGSALRLAGHQADAKGYLARGLDLAHHCGAAPLSRQAQAELRATGARPRRPHLTGPGSLTPSELRIAELAAAGHANREIAQQLFITIKTVEVHLVNIYRKLGISRRHDLHDHLTSRAPVASSVGR